MKNFAKNNQQLVLSGLENLEKLSDKDRYIIFGSWMSEIPKKKQL